MQTSYPLLSSQFLVQLIWILEKLALSVSTKLKSLCGLLIFLPDISGVAGG